MTRPTKDLHPTCALVGRRIYEERVERDYTQEELADAVGIVRQTLSDIERARHVPSFTTLCFIAQEFGIGVNELMVDGAKTKAKKAS